MSEQMTSRAFSALRWGYAGYAVRTVTGFASGIVLARLLGPKPFGQVAAATLVFGLANQLADGGFTTALVQAPELCEADVRFAFTFQITTGAVLTAICALIAPLIGLLLHDPQVGDVVRVTSLVFLIQAFGQSSAALLKRRLDLRPLQTAQVLSSVIAYVFVGIPAAALGAGVWSLVAAQLAQSLLFSAMVFARASHSVTPCYSRSSMRLARFGVKVAGANILNWSITNFDNAFVGRAFGSAALGLYSRAFNTVSAPAEAVISTWQQVLVASCSRMGNRAHALQRAYLASISAVGLITFPVFWSLALCAPWAVAGLYGPRWADAAPLLTPLALAISLHAVMAMAGPMLTAADQVKREVQRQGLSLLVAIAAFSFCALHSAVALAWAVLGVYGFRFVAMTQPTLRLLDLPWSRVFRVLRGPAAIGAVTAAGVWGAGQAASMYSVRPGWMLLVLTLTGMSMIAAQLLLAADWIFSRELVMVMTRLSGSFPGKVSRWLQGIDAKQSARETPAGKLQYRNELSERLTATE